MEYIFSFNTKVKKNPPNGGFNFALIYKQKGYVPNQCALYLTILAAAVEETKSSPALKSV